MLETLRGGCGGSVVTSPAAARACPQCGTALTGAGSVEGLCAACLLSLGAVAGRDRHRGERSVARGRPTRGRRAGPGVRCSPIGTGIVAPAWAMPAELLRQAAQRLRLAASVSRWPSPVSIVVINLIEALGLAHALSHLALKNVIAAVMVGVSAAVVWLAHSGRLAPTRLLRVSLGYEIVVALAISMGDHLEPLGHGRDARHDLLALRLDRDLPALRAGVAALGAPRGLASAIDLAARLPGRPGARQRRRRRARVLVAELARRLHRRRVAMFATIVIRGLQELGCYRLVEKLDHGGMGEIWRARHRMLARPVAVKLIRPELLGVKSPVEAASLVARFQREAEATAALHSAHTIALHDFGVTPEGAFYYVMELLDGIDLETLVRRFGPVPPERAIHLLIQACDSLAEAHATGLVHRDVKPANMLTCHWGLKWDFVKMLDFGLVKTRLEHGRRRAPDLRGHDHRHAGLHGARGCARRTGDRRARRPLRSRLRRLLAAHGRARVRRPHAGRDPAAPRQDAARSAVRAERRDGSRRRSRRS